MLKNERIDFMKIIETARNYVGRNYEHFCAAYGWGCTAWCAIFTSVCGRESGNGDVTPWSASCNDQIAWFKSHGTWMGKTNDICAGDWIYYDWDHAGDSRPADHVGIVECVKGDEIIVIEGNYGDYANNRTRVARRTIKKSYPYIYGIARPAYADNVPNQNESKQEDKIMVAVRELSKGSEGTDVKALQALLVHNGCDIGHCGIDGDFGADTDAAVRQYQQSHNCEVDGIVGVQTWNKLLS